MPADLESTRSNSVPAAQLITNYNASLARPFWRRRAKTCLPPRVDILAIKPILRFLLLFDG